MLRVWLTHAPHGRACSHELPHAPSVNKMSGRVQDILTRFAGCSLSEQLHLLRVLPSLVSVDFISHLPSLAVVKILTLLSVEEVTICLRVSRSWYESISHCKEYWLRICNSVGLSNARVRDHLPKHAGSTKNVGLSAWNHYRGIRTACSDCRPKVHIVPHVHNEFYPGRGNLIVWKDKTERRKLLSDSFELFGRPFAMTESARVMWAHSCNTKMVLATSDASWGVISTDGGLQFWNDYTIVDLVSERIGEACNKCALVARVKQSSQKMKCTVQLVYLHPGCSTVNVQEYECSIANKFALTESSFLHLESVSLVPSCDCSAPSESSLCYEHYLLVQVGGAILSFVHRHNAERKLEQLHCYSPSNNPTALTSAVFLGNRFRLSEDQCLVAMTSSNRVCVWDLRNQCTICEAVIPIASSRAHSWCCLAIGHLYAVVCNEDSADVAIICVSNGQLLHKFKLARHPMVVSNLFLLEQGWLSSIDIPFPNNFNFAYTRWAVYPNGWSCVITMCDQHNHYC